MATYFRFSLLLTFLILTGLTASATDQIVLEYSFDQPLIEDVLIDGVIYQSIKMANAPNGGITSHPALPGFGARVLIPYGSRVSGIEIVADDKLSLGSGFVIEPVSLPYPLSAAPGSVKPTLPDPVVYASSNPYPENSFKDMGNQIFRGYNILILKLQPVEYIPVSGELFYFPQMKVIVNLEATDDQYHMFRGLPVDGSEVLSKVDNPDNLISYEGAAKSGPKSYDMLILTTPSLVNAFMPLKNYHDAHGISTEIRTTIDVGSTNSEDIRAYVTERYLNDGIEYLLIGADDDIIPSKDIYIEAYGDYIDYDMPVDNYFGCLDGTYNYDGDAFWGEPRDGDNGEDVDLIAEVFVGRATVGDLTEAARFVNKTIAYLESDDPYLEKVLLCGEHLGFGGLSEYAGPTLNELIDFSNANGVSTTGIPSFQYNIGRLYDMSYEDNNWPSSEVVDRINNDLHIINHFGHGNYNWALKLTGIKAGTLPNNNKYCFLYSQACMSGGFDHGDCWSEQFTVKSDFGAFATIMNARYGWGSGNSTDGPSQRFNREFWDAIFSSSENKPQIGKANQDSKEDNLYRLDETCMRWCYYELNLVGDPTIMFKSTWIEMDNAQFSEQTGDGDGILEGGETIELVISIGNHNPQPLLGATATLTIDDAAIVISSGTAALGDIPANGSNDNAGNPLVFDIPVGYVPRIDSFLVNVTANDGAFEETLVIEQAIGGVNVLIVSDAGPGAVERYYTDCFDLYRIPYDLITPYPAPDSATLSAYDIVVWFTGDTDWDPFNDGEILGLRGYLNGGGNLFLSGQGIASQLQSDDRAFLNNYLKAEYNSSFMVPILASAAGGQLLGAGDSLCIIGNGGADNQGWPDHISPVNGSSSEINYVGQPGMCAISYAGDYRLVFFSFGFEAIVSGDWRWHNREDVFISVMDFLNCNSPQAYPVASGVAASPGDPMHMIDHTPQISWSYFDPGGSPQQMFQVQVGGGNWDSGPVAGSETSVTYSGLELNDGMEYDIKVRVFNGSLWSNWEQTIICMNSIPIANGLTPQNMQGTTTNQPILTHNNGDDTQGDPLLYSYELYADAQLQTLVASAGNQPEGYQVTNWSVPVSLTEDEDYYWRVKCDDPYESGQWGTSAAFWVNAINEPPGEFGLISPDNDSRLSEMLPTFIWSGSIDSDPYDNISYSLIYAFDAEFLNGFSINLLTDTSATITDSLEYDSLYYWKVVAYDEFDGQTTSSEIFEFATPVTWIRGDANRDGSVNIGDAGFIINFIFNDGPAPVPMDAGDANSDGTSNLGDSGFIINYIFYGGPSPFEV